MLYLVAPHVGFMLDIPVSLGEKEKKEDCCTAEEKLRLMCA